MKKFITPVVILIIILFGLWWAFNHSFIEIALEKPGVSTEYSVGLTNQTGQTANTQTKSGSVKKLVRKGSYEVLVKQGEASYFAIVNAGGFLSTNKTSALLSKENGRTYIGNDPNPCTYLVSGVLLSSSCGSRINKLQIHIPATATLPTFSKKSSSPFSGFIEGIVGTKEGTVAIVKAPGLDENQGAPHTAYSLKSDANIIRIASLDALTEGETYEIAKYQDGFLAYRTNSDQAYYYASSQSKPTTIKLSKPKDESLKLQYIETKGQALLMHYSSISSAENKIKQSSEVHTEIEGVKKKSKSEIVVQAQAVSKNYAFDYTPLKVSFCETDKLCLLNNGVLDVYDISTNKLKKILSIINVVDFSNTTSGLLVAKNDTLLTVDISKKQGHIVLSFGKSTFCGMGTDTASSVICLKNEKGRKVALLINRAKENNDSIDKKIEQLFALPEIKDISIYGRFIHISPNAGELIYDETLKTHRYDTTVVKNVNSKISLEIDKLGIDRSIYTVVFTIK